MTISISNLQMFASFLSLSCQIQIFSIVQLWRETSVWVIVDLKVFVAFFFFLWLSRSLHLSWRLISLICVPWARLEPSSVFIIRTGRCSFALPPLPITSWDLLETSLHTDAFPWSLWSSVTYALSKTNFKCCLGQVLFFILDTIWSQEFY